MTTTLPIQAPLPTPTPAAPVQSSAAVQATPFSETTLLDTRGEEYRLGPLSAIPPGEGRQFHIGGRDIAVFHARNGQAYATQAFCPHQAGPLADGLLGGTTLVCPFHAWKFDLATGQPLLGTCGLQTYTVRLDDDGIVYVIV